MYLCIYEKLGKRISKKTYCETYPIKEFFVMLGELFRVPKQLRRNVLKEMERMNLVKINGKEIELVKIDQNEKLKPYFL